MSYTLKDCGSSSLRSMKTPALILICFANTSEISKTTVQHSPHSTCLGVAVCIFYQQGMAVMHFREHHVPILLTGQVCVAISPSFLGKEGRGHLESKSPRWRDGQQRFREGRIFSLKIYAPQPHSNMGKLPVTPF